MGGGIFTTPFYINVIDEFEDGRSALGEFYYISCDHGKRGPEN